MDLETLKRLAAKSNNQRQKMRAAINNFDQKTDPRNFETINSGIPNLDYGNDYDPPREPNDGEIIIPSKYVTCIPYHLFDEMRSMGYVAYYYSLPAIEFAQVIFKVFTHPSFQERLQIVNIKPYWDQEIKNDTNAHVVTIRVECEESIIYISVIHPLMYPTGSVIIFSSDEYTVSMFQDYFSDIKRFALFFWQKMQGSPDTTEIPDPSNFFHF